MTDELHMTECPQCGQNCLDDVNSTTVACLACGYILVLERCPSDANEHDHRPGAESAHNPKFIGGRYDDC